jgi:hypothetical protein
MPSARFEPAIPASKRLQSYAVHRTATEIGCRHFIKVFVCANTQALLLANKEVYLEVNDETSKYVYVHVSWKECREKSQHKDS